MHPAVNDTAVRPVVGDHATPAERDKHSTEVIWAGSLSHTMTYASVPDRDYRRQEG
jgi:2,3-bisphosphoglycerate-independent phosphoglycerate mutase